MSLPVCMLLGKNARRHSMTVTYKSGVFQWETQYSLATLQLDRSGQSSLTVQLAEVRTVATWNNFSVNLFLIPLLQALVLIC